MWCGRSGGVVLALSTVVIEWCWLGAGCGRTTQATVVEGAAGAAGSRANDQAAAELASAQCSYLERCDPDALHLFSKSSLTACIDYFRCQLERELPWERASATAATLESCLDSLVSRDCPNVNDEPFTRFSYAAIGFPWGAECGWPGLEERLAPPPDAPELNETCLRYGERAACARGTYCALDGAPRFGALRCGICEARRPLGTECDESQQCNENTGCVHGECQTRVGPGEPCTDSEECQGGTCESGVCARSAYAPTPYAERLDHPCNAEGDCGNQAGLSCREGRCQALRDVGEACTIGGCRRGLFCIDGACKALGCTLDPGEPCETFCSFTFCNERVCSELPDREGEPCAAVCANGLVCAVGRCVHPSLRAIGAPCDFDSDCDSGHCDRDLSEFCSENGCVIPTCDKCGVCEEFPEPSECG